MRSLSGEEPDFTPRRLKGLKIYTYGFKDSSGYHFYIKNPTGMCIGRILTAIKLHGPDWIDEEF